MPTLTNKYRPKLEEMEEFKEDVTPKSMSPMRLWENSQFMTFSQEINAFKHSEKYKRKNIVAPHGIMQAYEGKFISWHQSRSLSLFRG